MPLFQRCVMFFSVTLPFAGLIAASALLWHRGIGWPEMIVMSVLYTLIVGRDDVPGRSNQGRARSSRCP
jgi:hypothetical protein